MSCSALGALCHKICGSCTVGKLCDCSKNVVIVVGAENVEAIREIMRGANGDLLHAVKSFHCQPIPHHRIEVESEEREPALLAVLSILKGPEFKALRKAFYNLKEPQQRQFIEFSPVIRQVFQDAAKRVPEVSRGDLFKPWMDEEVSSPPAIESGVSQTTEWEDMPNANTTRISNLE